MHYSKKQVSTLKDTMRDFDALMELLEEPLITTEDGPLLTKAKPLTPAQTEKLFKQTFKSILDILAHARLEYDLKTRQRELRPTAIEATGNANVINPKLLVALRRDKLLAARLKLVSTMFKEVLLMYEKATRTKYQTQGTVK